MPPTILQTVRLGFAAAGLAAAAWNSPAAAEPSAADENAAFACEVEAAYLYKLTRYVEWPAQALGSPADPFVIAVISRDPAAEAIIDRTLRGKTTPFGSRIQVVSLAPGAPLPARCEIAFVLRSANLHAADLRALVDHRPLLLVGESRGFAEHGGVVNFIFVDDNVRLQINPDRAEELGLRLRSLLASAAQLVHDKQSD